MAENGERGGKGSISVVCCLSVVTKKFCKIKTIFTQERHLRGVPTVQINAFLDSVGRDKEAIASVTERNLRDESAIETTGWLLFCRYFFLGSALSLFLSRKCFIVISFINQY